MNLRSWSGRRLLWTAIILALVIAKGLQLLERPLVDLIYPFVRDRHITSARMLTELVVFTSLLVVGPPFALFLAWRQARRRSGDHARAV